MIVIIKKIVGFLEYIIMIDFLLFCIEMYHLLKYPDNPGILLSHFYPAFETISLRFSITCPDVYYSGLSKKAELEIEEAP